MLILKASLCFFLSIELLFLFFFKRNRALRAILFILYGNKKNKKKTNLGHSTKIDAEIKLMRLGYFYLHSHFVCSLLS